MDFGTIGERLPFIIAAVVFVLLWQFVFKRRRPETAHREIVQSLLSEVGLNQAMVEVFHQQQRPRKFEMVSWLRHKNKLDFLDESLQDTIAGAFSMAEDFNRQIEAAKKGKSAVYLDSIDVDKLKEPLAKSRQGLEQWRRLKIERRESTAKHSSLIDRLFGGRDY